MGAGFLGEHGGLVVADIGDGDIEGGEEFLSRRPPPLAAASMVDWGMHMVVGSDGG